MKNEGFFAYSKWKALHCPQAQEASIQPWCRVCQETRVNVPAFAGWLRVITLVLATLASPYGHTAVVGTCRKKKKRLEISTKSPRRATRGCPELLSHQQLDPRCYFSSAANNSNNAILVSSLMGNFQVQPDLVQRQQVSVEIRQIHFSDPEYE